MALTIEATYEDGVLKPAQAWPLKEHEKVRVTIEPELSVAESTYGMIGWKGSHEAMEQLLAEGEEAEELP